METNIQKELSVPSWVNNNPELIRLSRKDTALKKQYNERVRIIKKGLKYMAWALLMGLLAKISLDLYNINRRMFEFNVANGLSDEINRNGVCEADPDFADVIKTYLEENWGITIGGRSQ